MNVDDERRRNKKAACPSSRWVGGRAKNRSIFGSIAAAKRYAMTITDYNYERPDLLPTLLYRNGQPKEDFCLSAERVFQQKQPLSAGYDPPTIKHIKYF